MREREVPKGMDKEGMDCMMDGVDQAGRVQVFFWEDKTMGWARDPRAPKEAKAMSLNVGNNAGKHFWLQAVLKRAVEMKLAAVWE